EAPQGGGEGQEEAEEEARTRAEPGTRLVLRALESGQEIELTHVRSFAFDEVGRYLAYVVAAPDGQGDGLHIMDLAADQPTGRPLDSRPFAYVESTTWWQEGARLAWVSADEDEEGEPGDGSLMIWDGRNAVSAMAASDAPAGWMLPAENRLQFSDDGGRVFFGLRPAASEEEAEAEESAPTDSAEAEEPFDAYDVDAILADRGVDVWNTNDPLIVPNQKRAWNREQERTYAAVYHVDRKRVVQLADTLVDDVDVTDNPNRALAWAARPYLKERTWAGSFSDLYVVDLQNGERVKVAERYAGGGSAVGSWMSFRERSVSLSPGGRYVAFFRDEDWHLWDARSGTTRNLTRGMNVPFYDVDNDYPDAPGGYGVGGWVEGDRAVLIHDKYDVWQFPTGGGEPVNLTGGQGRAERRALRVLDIDPEQDAFGRDATVHLFTFSEPRKNFGFYRTRVGRGGLERLLEEDKMFRFLAKADDADVLLYTREDYDEFPDLWVADLNFGGARKLTDVNPQIAEFAWGTSELVEWTSDDGVPLQGVVIKPGNYQEGTRYPVLTYFYRFFSQRLHEFNEPVVNHRPSFPIYASDGYIVFLPDVRFEVGRPGISALKSVVPGVKRLVELGLADPDALGLHGHSWSGYTTAYIVTQTNIFAAAVAGAPVSNMTSAYGGIRWG
ncbi:MAG TPA: prolyl oligopeptidase family serine peptidase, partial [Gemmatimonadota bacterium]|nr:prolyl oligopeptidase family serine peptidase [Gemmatimonadota bacterium]